MREVTPLPPWMLALGVGEIGVALALITFTCLSKDLTIVPKSIAFVSFTALVAVGLTVTTFRVIVVANPVAVHISTGWWRASVPMSDVLRVNTVMLTPKNTGGIGLRFPGRRRRALLTSFGVGVEIIRRSDGMHLLARTDSAESWVAYIRHHAGLEADPAWAE